MLSRSTRSSQAVVARLRARRAASRRGFTITELLVVIAIIGVMVAAAAPSFAGWLKDRRVTDAAQNIADLYRTARARAMGRGSAMYVGWDQGATMPTDAQPFGQFVLREAVMGPNTAFHDMLPLSTCNGTANFANSGTTSKHITTFEPRRERYKPTSAQFRDWGDNPLAFAGICYTPRGRVFFHPAPGVGNMVPLAGVPRVEVTNTEDQMRRQVIIPPTGAARVVLRVQ